MAIPTSRTKEKADIRINTAICIGCGLCVSVCNDFSIVVKDGKVTQSDTSVFGCMGCGHCMAICPTGAIGIYGRYISPDDLFEIPKTEDISDFDQLMSLFRHRRSIREFKDKDVEDELVEKILTAAKTAPMGLPPSDVHVMVLKGIDKTRKFARDYSDYLKGMKYITSKFFLMLIRPFLGKETSELFRCFIKPLFKIYTEDFSKSNNSINYDAPLAMYFYATPYADPADPIIAATYAMIAAESLGLGSCMLGGIHPFIQSGNRAKKFRKSYDIKFKSREGLFVIFGYPKVKYRKGINRTFALIKKL